MYDSIAKTNVLSGVKVELVQATASQQIVWVTHNFQFLGGSLGSSEGEKITKSFEYGLANKIPVVVQCKTGGARMQEGTHSLTHSPPRWLTRFLAGSHLFTHS